MVPDTHLVVLATSVCWGGVGRWVGGEGDVDKGADTRLTHDGVGPADIALFVRELDARGIGHRDLWVWIGQMACGWVGLGASTQSTDLPPFSIHHVPQSPACDSPQWRQSRAATGPRARPRPPRPWWPRPQMVQGCGKRRRRRRQRRRSRRRRRRGILASWWLLVLGNDACGRASAYVHRGGERERETNSVEPCLRARGATQTQRCQEQQHTEMSWCRNHFNQGQEVNVPQPFYMHKILTKRGRL